MTAFETDIAIIGAGPSGLFAVFECGMKGLKTCVFDALPEIGGQCTALYPEKPIFDIPGFPTINAAELIERLEKQASPFQPSYFLNQKIVSISNNGAKFTLKSSSGQIVTVKAIIVASGPGAFGPNTPPLDGIAAYEETGAVQYMVRRKEDLRGKKIVIAGGGDSAIDWALSLAPISDRLYLVHRRDKFRAAPESIRQLQYLVQQGQAELVAPYQLKKIQGQDGFLSSVIVVDDNDKERVLHADYLLPFFGLAADLGPIADWGLSIDKKHIPINPTTCLTNQEGVYAIGDIAAYDNKPKLILTGFHEAALAAQHIYKSLHPGQEMHLEYSTTRGVPGF